MNLKRTLLPLVLAAGLLQAAGAAPATLDSVCASLARLGVTTGTFTQEKTVPSLARPLKSSGTFLFCPEGLVWNTRRPVSSTMTVTESRIVQVAPDGRKTVLDGSDNEAFKGIARTISALFKGDRAELERQFDVAFSAEGTAWSMELTPKDKTIASVMEAVSLSGSLSSGEASFDALTITERGGGTIAYAFSGQEHKAALSAGERAYFAAP